MEHVPNGLEFNVHYRGRVYTLVVENNEFKVVGVCDLCPDCDLRVNVAIKRFIRSHTTRIVN